MNLTKNQVNSIYGFIIGDALGVPYEFSKSNTLKKVQMVGNLAHNQPKGTWSDDTSFLLATLDSKYNFSVYDIKKRYLEVLSGKYSIDNHLFDIGKSTKDKLLFNTVKSKYKDGNGALMRILPFYIINQHSRGLYKYFKEYHDLTHDSAISQICCFELLRVYTYFFNNVTYNKVEVVKKIAEQNNINNYTDKFGFVLGSLYHVVDIASKAKSFEEGMMLAINLGGDTDTHCAIIGSLLGIKYPKELNKFKKDLRGMELIQNILNKSE